MVHWVGKELPKMAQYFPAQLWEKMDVRSAAAEPDYRAFIDDKHGHNLLLFAYIPIIIKFIIFVV